MACGAGGFPIMGVWGLAPRGFPPLLAHVKQQSVVNIVNAEHGDDDNGIDNDKFVAFHVLKQED